MTAAPDVAATEAPAPDAVRSSGRWVFVTGTALLVIWVLVPIWLLLVNALSAPEEVTAFPKSLVPSFDTASLEFFFGFRGVLEALWNSVQALLDRTAAPLLLVVTHTSFLASTARDLRSLEGAPPYLKDCHESR